MLKRVSTERNTVRNYKDAFIVQVKLLSVAYEYFTVLFRIAVYTPVFVLELLFFFLFFFFFAKFSQGAVSGNALSRNSLELSEMYSLFIFCVRYFGFM